MTADESPSSAEQPIVAQTGTLQDDAALDAAIEAQREAVAASERAFVQARTRFDQQRRHLRALEEERERRRRTAEGVPVSEPATPARRRRSTTGVDALLGRDGIDPDLPFARFRLLSLQRQEIVLHPTGERDAQVLHFTEPASGAQYEARTFGEARRYHERGFTQGRPRDPLQRQEVWYVAEGKPGRLRLDQIFVEREAEDE
jgi:hypothetical protein